MKSATTRTITLVLRPNPRNINQTYVPTTGDIERLIENRFPSMLVNVRITDEEE